MILGLVLTHPPLLHWVYGIRSNKSLSAVFGRHLESLHLLWATVCRGVDQRPSHTDGTFCRFVAAAACEDAAADRDGQRDTDSFLKAP